MSKTTAAIMNDLYAKGFVPGPRVEAILDEHIGPLETEVERLRGILARIVDDATGDINDAGKRLWPIRAANQRLARAVLERRAVDEEGWPKEVDGE